MNTDKLSKQNLWPSELFVKVHSVLLHRKFWEGMEAIRDFKKLADLKEAAPALEQTMRMKNSGELNNKNSFREEVRLELLAPPSRGVMYKKIFLLIFTTLSLARASSNTTDAYTTEKILLSREHSLLQSENFNEPKKLTDENAIEHFNYTLYTRCITQNPRLSNNVFNLDELEKFALCTYTEYEFHNINNTLRENKGEVLYFPLLIKYLDQALLKFPNYTTELVTRNITLKPKQIKEYDKGKIITWHAYSSSSYGENLYKGNVHFVIKSRTGKDIHGISQYPEENEVLFPRNSTFKVLKNPVFNSNDSTYLIELEQL